MLRKFSAVLVAVETNLELIAVACLGCAGVYVLSSMAIAYLATGDVNGLGR